VIVTHNPTIALDPGIAQHILSRIGKQIRRSKARGP
jgi:hypothetical protein